jgi:hypothetical protein
MNDSVKIRGDAEYPESNTDWVDNRDETRRLHVTEVVPGDRLGREIRGTIKRSNLEREYATDLATFHGVWRQP